MAFKDSHIPTLADVEKKYTLARVLVVILFLFVSKETVFNNIIFYAIKPQTFDYH